MSDNDYAFPKDVHKQLQWTMTCAHGAIQNGYTSIYKHLEKPPMDDLSNFLSYCSVWTAVVEKHHSLEERYLFPELQKKLDFSHELEQHKPIHEGIDKVIRYLKEAKADHSKFDAPALRELMASFQNVLFTHLDEEIQNLSSDRMKVFTKEEMQAICDGLDREAKKEAVLMTDFPFALGNLPLEYKDKFPPFLPTLVRYVLLPYVIIPYHKGWWKYCTNKL